MSKFVIVKDACEIKLSEKWVDSQNFNREKIVDQHGKRVSTDYAGHHYQLIAKKERQFSCLEKLGRRFLGALAVIFSFGHAYFQSKTVKHLLTKNEETLKFAILKKIEIKKIENPLPNPTVEAPKNASLSNPKVPQNLDRAEIPNPKKDQVNIVKKIIFPEFNMPITVKYLGREFEVRADPGDTIMDLKKKIHQKTGGFSLEGMRLYRGDYGYKLDDDRTLAYYSIIRNNLITLSGPLFGE